jgi:spore germination cell wall hydrolase CwlJ-like protein
LTPYIFAAMLILKQQKRLDMKTILVLSTLAALTLTGAYADTDVIDLTPMAEEGDSQMLSVDPVVPDNASIQANCLAQAIYFEGGNQSVDGMEAIGQVIMNRVESTAFPDSICGVVQQGPRDGGPIALHRCQFSYFCDGKGDTFPTNDTPGEINAADAAWTAAGIVLAGTGTDMTYGSDHYHADYASPPWANVYDLVVTVDAHLFYTSN